MPRQTSYFNSLPLGLSKRRAVRSPNTHQQSYAPTCVPNKLCVTNSRHLLTHVCHRQSSHTHLPRPTCVTDLCHRHSLTNVSPTCVTNLCHRLVPPTLTRQLVPPTVITHLLTNLCHHTHLPTCVTTLTYQLVSDLSIVGWGSSWVGVESKGRLRWSRSAVSAKRNRYPQIIDTPNRGCPAGGPYL